MKSWGKKGMSTIVVTLIIILISLVAVGIVWVVVTNLLKSGTEQVSSGFGQLFISLELQKVQIEPSGDWAITVHRNSGTGDLTGISFIVSDGTNTKVVKKDTTLSELDTNKFTITSVELGSDFGFVREVSIAPIVDSSVGNIVDKKELSNKDILKSLGAVSWWKLDGNANDEIGNNGGTLQGGLSFTDGRFGKAGNFGGSSYINKGSINNLPSGNSPRTMMAWIKPTGYPDSTYNGIVAYSGGTCYQGSLLSIKNNGMLSQAFWCNDMYQTSGNPAQLNSWNFAAFTYDSSVGKLFLNGNEVASKSFTGVNTASSGYLAIGSTDNPGRLFQGQIDEVIIFNQSLTAQQIKSLSQLDLTSS